MLVLLYSRIKEVQGFLVHHSMRNIGHNQDQDQDQDQLSSAPLDAEYNNSSIEQSTNSHSSKHPTQTLHSHIFTYSHIHIFTYIAFYSKWVLVFSTATD